MKKIGFDYGNKYNAYAHAIAPTISAIRTMFKDLVSNGEDLNYYDDDLTDKEIKYAEAQSIADRFKEVPYLNGETLYDFCYDYTIDEDNMEELYPLVHALNDGQKAMTEVNHYYDVVRYSMSDYPEDMLTDKIDDLEDTYSICPFDIYTGVDRSIYDGTFALTSDAYREDAYTEEGLMAHMFNKENLASTAVSGIFTGIIFIVGGLMMVYSAVNLYETAYNYYHPDYDDIPLDMVDLVETRDGDRYIKYDVVLEAEAQYGGEYAAGDLNAFAGARWNALYYTKSYEAGEPLLAEFEISYRNNTPDSDCAPVHRFGEVVCYDLNKYNFDHDSDNIYLSVYKSENQKSAVADVPDVVGSIFSAGWVLLAGGVGALAGVGCTLGTQKLIKKRKQETPDESFDTPDHIDQPEE